jgi:hypothetical protein
MKKKIKKDTNFLNTIGIQKIPIYVTLANNEEDVEIEFIPVDFTSEQINEYLHKQYGENGWFGFNYK